MSGTVVIFCCVKKSSMIKLQAIGRQLELTEEDVIIYNKAIAIAIARASQHFLIGNN